MEKDTLTLLIEQIDKEIRKPKAQKLEDAQAIEDMLSSAGWQVLERWIDGRIVYETEKLQRCDREIIDLVRGKINGFKEVRNRVGRYLKLKQEAQKAEAEDKQDGA